jgi:molybdopterin converting factor small subunit
VNVDVRLFAPYKTAAGREIVTLSFPAAATVGDVLAELQRCYPRLRETLAPVRGRPALCPAAVLVGDRLADEGDQVRDGDVVYLVPSIVGG